MKKKPVKKAPTKTKQALPVPEKKEVTFPPSLPRKANFIIISVIFAWALLLYGNTVFNKFCIDDHLVTKNDVVRQGFKAIPLIFSSYLIDEDKNVGGQRSDYRPVAKATFAVEYGLWGEKPGRSHLVNMLFYFLASLITFYVLRRLLINYNILFPVLITLLFMAHPIHTEVVASLKSRDEILAYLFGMSGMYSLLSYSYSRNFKYILLTCIFFILGVISKLSALPFIGLYILVLYFFSDLKPRTLITSGLVIILAAAASYIIPRFFLEHTFRTNFYFENALYFEKNLWLRLGTAMMSLLFYLRMLIYPYPLLYYYGFDMIPLTSLFSPMALLSVLIYGVILGYAIFNIRKKTFLSFAILWYLFGIFPYSNLPVAVVGVVAERFAFLASLGFIMAVVYLIFKVFKTDPKSLTIELESRIKIIGLVVVLLIPYGVLTINRNTNWRTMMTLFSKDIPRLERSAKANYQYAGFLITNLYNDENFLKYGHSNQFLRETIKKHLRISLKVYPKGYNTLNDLGTLFLFVEKRYDSALYYFQKTVEVDSSLTPGWINMGMSYRQLGNYTKAMACYQKVLEIQPKQIKAYFAIADLYNDMGDVAKAIHMNEKIMEKYPEFDMPYVNIGNYYMQKQDTAGAVRYWEQAAQRNPTAEICMQLSVLYKMHNDMEKAGYYYNLGQKARIH
ncbi:MAG: tetratricopeptide repeat protein [Bacteroidota bacterium]